MEKSNRKFQTGIIYNPNYRRKVRRGFLGLREAAESDLEKLSTVHSIKESKKKIMTENWLDLAQRGVKVCEKAERQEKFHNQRGTFVLFQDKETYVFDTHTFRDKKDREGNIYIKGSLPKHKYITAILHKKPTDHSGFTQIDVGEYHFKQTGPLSGYYHFWGKKEKYFFSFDKSKLVDNNKNLIEIRFKRIN